MLVRTLALTLAATVLMVPAGAPASAAPDHFTPKPGPTFNSPVGGPDQRRKIFRRIMRSINSTPKGAEIDIFSWNFLTSEGADALLRAQRRGVRVRLVMDDRNVKEIDNPPFRRLRSSLHRWNKSHPRQRNSWARLCQGTCRSGSGSAHSKFFLFSDVGRAKRVVMQGSANFTIASTTNQWNDIYTHTGNRQVWKFYTRIFNQAARDKPVFPAVRRQGARQVPDDRLPDQREAGGRPRHADAQQRVTCRGATNTASGRTKIQIAPDVIRQERGMRLARKLRTMWNNGCNIRIGYTVVGIDVGRFLRQSSGRGPVPMKHLTQDFNGDGEFDNYFHLKSMTIRGQVRRRSAPATPCSTARPTGRASPRSATRTSASTEPASGCCATRSTSTTGTRTSHATGGPPRCRERRRSVSGRPADLRQRRERRLRGRHAGGLRPVRQHAVGLTGGQTSDPRPQARRPGHPAGGPGGPAARRVRRRAAGLDVLDTA